MKNLGEFYMGLHLWIHILEPETNHLSPQQPPSHSGPSPAAKRTGYSDSLTVYSHYFKYKTRLGIYFFSLCIRVTFCLSASELSQA